MPLALVLDSGQFENQNNGLVPTSYAYYPEQKG